jgi:hypothetical protein
MVATALDVFRGDAFRNITLTDLVNKNPFIPFKLSSLEIFEPEPILTTKVAVDTRQGKISLIQSSPRGAPSQQRFDDEKRVSQLFTPPRLALETKIRADEVQDVRSLDDPKSMLTLKELVARRLMGSTGLTKYVEYTHENHRLGAIQGYIYDADGSTLINMFTTFGISPPTPYNFDLKQATGPGQVDGYVRTMISEVIRTIKRKSQGDFIEGQSEVCAVCGDAFWDAFVNHPDVVETYKFYYGAASLREDKAFGELRFGGVYWINYRGSDDTSTIAVNTNRAQFFVRKAPGLFTVYYAPGETFEDVNQKGKPMYIYRKIPGDGKLSWVGFEINSFALHLCNRPEVLQTGLLAAGD